MCQIFAQSLQKFKAISSISQLNVKLSNSQNHSINNINLLKVWQKTGKDKANSPNKIQARFCSTLMCIEVSYNHSVKLISLSTKLKYAKIFYTNKRFEIKDNNTTASQELKFVYERKTCNYKKWPQHSISEIKNIG